MNVLITKLKNYNPTNKERAEFREEVLKNAKRLYVIRNEIIRAFKDGTFLLPKDAAHKNRAKLDDENDKETDTEDMSDLETEESAEQRRNQRGQGLKILTPKQMLSRLPISLAQLRAGNNSVRLKKFK